MVYIRTPKGKYKFHYFKYKMPVFGKLIYAIDFSRLIQSILLNLKNGQNKSEYLASRFASKEAYLKASGKMTTKLSSIETLNDSNGKPHLFVNNEEVGEVSISHDTFAIAVVLLNKE